MSTISLLPDYVGIVQDTSLDFYNNSTNLLNTMGNYLAEINENIKFNKSLVTTNVLSAYTLLYNELNSTNFTVANYNIVNGQVTQSGVKPLDNQFVLYFVEKYLSLTESYKTTINKGITNNSYFADLLTSPLMMGTQKPAEILQAIFNAEMAFNISANPQLLQNLFMNNFFYGSKIDFIGHKCQIGDRRKA